MKIGIISIHYGVNFGSALQAYALPQYIKSTFPNAETEVVNYIPPRYRFKNQYSYNGGTGIKKRVGWMLRAMQRFINDSKYKRYLSSITNVSPQIFDAKTAKDRYKEYDCLIAGSDQIWNSDYNQGFDPMYYLCFGSDRTRKISYAASCGKNKFSDNEWTDMKKSLESFSKISIRESSTAEIMREKGINCYFVLDPTYLLSKEEWSKIEKKEDIREQFLLIYLLDVDGKDIIDYAKNVAMQRNLKTVLIVNGPAIKKYDVDYVMWNKTPDSYIWLFRNASYVVTNSFHGTSFSINMERQFVVFKRDKYNSRIDSILGAMGLEDRCVTLNGTNILQDIDYSYVNEKKEALLIKSKQFIKEALCDE